MTRVHRNEPRKRLLPGSWVVSEAYWLYALASEDQYPATVAYELIEGHFPLPSWLEVWQIVYLVRIELDRLLGAII